MTLFLVFAMLLTMLAGCGGKTEESSNAGSAAPAESEAGETAQADASGDKVQLTIAMWGDEARAEAYQKTLAPFCEANNCTVKIELVPIGDFFDKLASQLG